MRQVEGFCHSKQRKCGDFATEVDGTRECRQRESTIFIHVNQQLTIKIFVWHEK